MIKGFVPRPDHFSETGKFQGAPEIEKDIDDVEIYLPSKVKKFG